MTSQLLSQPLQNPRHRQCRYLNLLHHFRSLLHLAPRQPLPGRRWQNPTAKSPAPKPTASCAPPSRLGRPSPARFLCPGSASTIAQANSADKYRSSSALARTLRAPGARSTTDPQHRPPVRADPSFAKQPAPSRCARAGADLLAARRRRRTPSGSLARAFPGEGG